MPCQASSLKLQLRHDARMLAVTVFAAFVFDAASSDDRDAVLDFLQSAPLASRNLLGEVALEAAGLDQLRLQIDVDQRMLRDALDQFRR